MSTLIMALCWPAALPPVQKFVLISLADQANDEGVCWPKVASIQERTCYGTRAVQNALRELQHQGLIDVEIGAKKANRYTIKNQAIRALLSAQRPPPDDSDGCTTCTPHDVHPAPGAPRTTCTPHDVHPLRARAPRARAANTNTTPNTNTPPIPPDKSRGAEEPIQGPPPVTPVVKRAPISLRRYIEECAARGVKPVAPDSPVFAYCETVGISREILRLHWREFKLRRLTTGKRQDDWPRTFLNSVKGNWYRLWYIRPNMPAELTTQGLQAQAETQAEEQRAQAHPENATQ